MDDIIVTGLRSEVTKTAANNLDVSVLFFWNNYCPVAGVEGVVGGVAEGRLGARGLVSGNAGIDLTSIRGRIETQFTRQGPQLTGGVFVTPGAEASVEFGLPEADGAGLELGGEARRETPFSRGMIQRLRDQAFGGAPKGFIGLQGGFSVIAGGSFKVGLNTESC